MAALCPSVGRVFPGVGPLIPRLGDVELRGIQQLDVGLGFEGGIAVVILAVILDRLSQSLMLEGERTVEARSRRWRSLWRTP